MKYLIIDTETNALFDFSKPADAEGQPRLCGITTIRLDDGDAEADAFSHLIKPDGWSISPEITAINGLTTERCEAEGIPVERALTQYASCIALGYVVVAYNAQFDTKIMRAELRRAGMPDLFEQTPNICTMRACKALGVEKAGPKKGGFPKLSDSYRHFFDCEHLDPHTSLGDARACLEIFRKLRERDALPEPEVHYAKQRPEA